MKSALIALSFSADLVTAGVPGISKAQGLLPNTQLRIAQVDEDVMVKKNVTPYGTKKIVKKRVGDGYGMRCKKVSVTKSNEMGDNVKKTATRCG
jgi:hypothetical protein